MKFWKNSNLRKRETKKIQEYEGRIRELSDVIKRNNIHIIGIPEEEEREKGAEQIIAENFPDPGKEKGIEIREAQRTPFRRNLNPSSA